MDCREQEDDIYDEETPWNIIDLYFNKQYLSINTFRFISYAIWSLFSKDSICS